MRATLFTFYMCAAVACTTDPTATRAELNADAGTQEPATSQPAPERETEPETEPDTRPRPAPDASPPSSSYIDALAYFQTSEEIEAWYQLVAALRSDFDAICGDTFCEGDFSNYESLRFRCSVEESAGTIGSCVWVFAASEEEIVPDTGAVVVTGHTFRCGAPLAPSTAIRDFVQALSAPGIQPLQAPLPGTDLSLYDALGDCL